MDQTPFKNTPGPVEDGTPEQFPVDTKILTKAHLYATNGDLLRIVVTNDESTAHCAPYREYNHGNMGVSIEDVTSFTMRCSRLDVTQEAVDAFVGSMPLSLDIPQVATWRRGIHVPSAPRKRLYSAVDPDDSTKMIGLLLEQDEQGRVVQLTWYKTRDTGTAFRTAPDELEFALVKDENDAPSIDPNDIGGWTWYYTTSAAT